MAVKKTAKKAPPKAAKSAFPKVEIGILGGTGLYEIEGIQGLKEYKLKTPLGDPSDAYIVGTLEGKKVAFLSRHGRGHRLLPAEINYRANVYGFKMLGVERVISVNSCGSLREEIHPCDFVFADQFIDKTHRRSTFFGEGIAAHIQFAEPVCPALAKFLHETAAGLGIRSHLGGVYVCMEGPAFSTKAESEMHRRWGGTVIGMTSATEAKLFREAEICYSTAALATDYDCWRESGESVSVGLVLQNLRRNIAQAKALIKKAVSALPPHDDKACGCRSALRGAFMTDPKIVPPAARKRLALIVGKYLG